MPQVINTNVASLNAQRNLNTSQGALSNALQRLSSGLRINSAKDDAAGLAIAEKMNAQSRGMTVAMRNANDGISAAQTAEAGLSAISSHLQRMRELAVQAASGQYDSENRMALDAEYQQLSSEITRAMDATNFNGKKLLDGSFTGINFQIGASTTTESQIAVNIASVQTASLGNITTASAALSAMTAIDVALNTVNENRADLGAIQARFEGVLTQLATAVENTEASRSRIMDTDYAAETAKLARAQILQQAGTAMLAQANALPQNVLSLLQG
ncbi:flagellin [Azovibrio restrictus]|uniref:flagellin N-terminal helical domain-containing protein n=1 Tax=Azovibrio restrictus TaxID=146938 RepID=UPI00040D8230|nr:flagellin [Azovibrio restrictus]